MADPNQQTYAAKQGYAVTPSDTVNLDAPCRALYIGTGGDVSLVGLDVTTAIVFKNVPSGTVLPVQTRRVNSAATTATDIVALY